MFPLKSLVRVRIISGLQAEVKIGIQPKMISWKLMLVGRNHMTKTRVVVEMKYGVLMRRIVIQLALYFSLFLPGYFLRC